MKYAIELHKSVDSIIIEYTFMIYNARDDIHHQQKRWGKREVIILDQLGSELIFSSSTLILDR